MAAEVAFHLQVQYLTEVLPDYALEAMTGCPFPTIESWAKCIKLPIDLNNDRRVKIAYSVFRALLENEGEQAARRLFLGQWHELGDLSPASYIKDHFDNASESQLLAIAARAGEHGG